MPPKRKYMTSHSSDTLSDTSSDHRPMPRKKRQRFHPSRQEVASSEQTSPPSAQLLELRRGHQRFSPSTSLSQDTRAQSQQDSSDARQQPREDHTPDQVELQRVRENVTEKFVPFKDQILKFQTDKKLRQHVEPVIKDIEALVDQAEQHDLEKLHKGYNDTLHTILNLETIVKNGEIEKFCRDFLLKPNLLLKDFQTSDDSSRAEQDPLNFTHIQNLTKEFINFVQRQKLPQGQHRLTLGINLTDAQYFLVRLVLIQSLNDKTIDKEIYRKARSTAYNASEHGKASQATYNASEHGKAQRAAYDASEHGKAQRATYNTSEHGKAQRAAYRTEHGKAYMAAYRTSEHGKAQRAAYRTSEHGKAQRAASQAAYRARKREEALAAKRNEGSEQPAAQHPFQDALAARNEQVPNPIQKKRRSQPRKPSDERINRLISEVHHFSSPTSSQHQSERLQSISPEFAQHSSETRQQPREDHTPDQVEFQMIRKNVRKFGSFLDQISPFLEDAKVSDEDKNHLLSTKQDIRLLVAQAEQHDVARLREVYDNTLANIDCLEMLVDNQEIEKVCQDFILQMDPPAKDHQTQDASSNAEQDRTTTSEANSFIRSFGKAAKTAGRRRFLSKMNLPDDAYFQVRFALIRNLQNREINMKEYRQYTRIACNAKKA